MVRNLWTQVVAIALVLSMSALVGAVEIPASWRDDANLNAVCRVGSMHAWAVGDHGCVLRSVDGGLTWEKCPVPDDVSLHAACFLTGQIGWVGGGGAVPFSKEQAGFLYFTKDGGETWQVIHTPGMPAIRSVRFFSQEIGIVAGAATSRFPSGVLRTDDGGKTWRPCDLGTLDFVPHWNAAAFATPDRGLLVGYRGRRAIVAGEQLMPSRGLMAGYRNWNAVIPTDALEGWAVGDGATVMRTRDGGLVWESAGDTLPATARDVFDFQAVAAVRQHLWVAGHPGGVVWHSPDHGQSWRPQAVGSSLPIHDLAFRGEGDGIAVGAMGAIWKTRDGGNVWEPVRGADRRAAVMVISTGPKEIPFRLLASLSGDQGYRSVTLLPVRRDLDLGGMESPQLSERTHEAILKAGGNVARTDWPLPLIIPEIESNRDALIADWHSRTEGMLEQVLLGRLVIAIRAWQPDIIVLNVSGGEDACSELIREAARLAAVQAGDATRFVGRAPHLPAWKVRKLYVNRTEAGPNTTSLDGTAVLSRLGESLADVADRAAACVEALNHQEPAISHFELLPLEPEKPEDVKVASAFFGGLAIAPGSASRRPVEAPRDDPRARALATQGQMLRGMTRRMFDDPRQAGGMLAQIEEISAGLPPDRAARQLLRLGDAHRVRHRWDLAEEMYVSLIRRYPAEPASQEAAKWLLPLWTSAEPVWWRMRRVGAVTQDVTVSDDSLGDRILKARAMAEEGIEATTPEEIAAAGLNADPLRVDQRREKLSVGQGATWEGETIAGWDHRAVQLLALLAEHHPTAFASDEVQATVALLGRRGSGDLQGRLAKLHRSESGVVPVALIQGQRGEAPMAGQTARESVRRAAQPPHLDADFSDECWQGAVALPLRGESAGRLESGSLVMVSYDEKFLYVAASVARVPGREVPPVQLGGRGHDAEMSGYDRLTLRLDRDLDGLTAYELAIDERGETAERCWDDPNWNPKWYVAASGDAERWRIECAIPMDELGFQSPGAGEVWGLTIGRIVPAVGGEGWPSVKVIADPLVDPGRIRFE